jgi:ribonucleoside-diphosphate reductase alpha chain
MTKDIYWLNKDSRKFLERGYLTEGETAEQRIRDIAETAQKYLNIEGFADKFERYMHSGAYSLSSPIWANFGRKRGLPISCFGSYIPDTMEGIMEKVSEVSIMTKHGGGTSGYFGDIRGRGTPISSGGESTGSVHFMELFDKVMEVVSQGNVRRGSFAAYLPIDHPDIEEFLKIKDIGNSIQSLSIGVCVSDEWMKKMIGGDKEYRRIWGLVIKKRFESGYPYIFFSDNANNQAPKIYKDKKMKILSQNLCAEICLPSNEKESFVCDLSSLNLEKWEDWKDTDAVETLVYFLDAVMSEFIEKTEGMKFMEAPRNFAINHRALGVGVLGWHSLLQSKMIAFESMEAKILNNQIWKTIRDRADLATTELAKKFGEAPIYKDSEEKRRNTTTLAVAPTTSCATEDTKFFLDDGRCVDYREFCKIGGLNLDDVFMIDIEDENGKKHNFHYQTKMLIKRNESIFEIFAYELEENDDILDII